MALINRSPELAETLRRLQRETFLRHVDWHDELDSTNTQAISLATRDDLALPRLIGAVRQTAGRGRGSNSWWSSDGALTFSLLFNPLECGLPLPRWPQVALMTGLAVADTLEGYLPVASVQLKWPNDVFVLGRKICGILVEVPPGRTDRLVVGIGLNVGNSLADAPHDVQDAAVSLVDLLGQDHPSLGDVLFTLIRKWDGWLKRLAAGELDFPMAWRSKCYLMGHRVTVTIGPETWTGTCLGLDSDGRLLVNTDNGIERVLAGTVRRLMT
jgi:BirA family biotin operon repressor/biotin-[acetyl-CoA-carboxylase] ligase